VFFLRKTAIALAKIDKKTLKLVIILTASPELCIVYDVLHVEVALEEKFSTSWVKVLSPPVQIRCYGLSRQV
jgi:hypothetical protein